MTFESNNLEVAIIGISIRFPGSNTVNKFWKNLIKGVELTSVFTEAKQKELEGKSNGSKKTIKAGGVLDDIELFDAPFFGFSPREAEMIDPQHRLFLECAWEALENAGYDSEREERPIGVYAGVGISTYLLYNLLPNNLMESMGFFSTLIGSDKDFVPTRVSYKLDLKGPSVSVGTACSSSLVAVHLAYQSLLSGECDMALAAGVSVKAPQNEVTLCPGIAGVSISPDGHCRAFDARAQGTIGGNGIGVVVLKRLEDALNDRDYIYAVIKGSAINNDGALKVSYTAPSEDAQARVIRAAQIMAEVEPETITYIEAHGTGTPMGDPIEIAALKQAFSTDKKGYCAIGSVKTNVGHLDAAAGIAGFIKTVLALDHKLLLPSLNFETPNPQIDFENSPFYVNTELSEWKANGTPRRAGVSSFGFGGTNAHVIIEEAPPLKTSTTSRPWQLLMLSAKTSSALETATANLAEHLKQHPDLNLADVAYTLQVGRRAFEHRRTVVCQDVEDAVSALTDPKRVLSSVQETSERPIAFMFTGLGTHYVNMAWELYQSEPTFCVQVDRCCEFLKPLLGLDLRDVMYPAIETRGNKQEAGGEKSGIDLRKMLGRDAEQADEATQKLNQTYLTQSALFVIEYALAQLWLSWGIRPAAMIGYSIGEYVAATLAGVLSLEDALTLVAKRAQMIQELSGGAMLAVPLSEEEVHPLLGEKLSLSAINGPKLCVIAGDTEAVDELADQLTKTGLACRRLQTSHAFHSHMMEAIAASFTGLVKTVSLNPPKIPYLSNVTGTWITAAQATDPNYWTQHLCQPVRFADGVNELWKQQQPILLEVGPGQTLSSLALQGLENVPMANKVALPSLRHSYDRQPDLAFLLNTLGQLWLSGVKIDWSGFYARERRHRIPLPTYPFERQHYWIEPPKQFASSRQVTLDRKPDIADWFYIPSWKRSILSAHQSNGTQVQSCNLVFIDECGLGVQLVKRLEQQDQDLIIVQVGSKFTKAREGVYTLNPQQRDDYNALFKELLAQQKIPKTIVHLWTVTPSDCTKSGLEWVDKVQEKGFYSLLFLAQALGRQNLTDDSQIVVVSNNLQEVTGDEILSPEKATLLGPVRTIAQEYPNISCRSIDVVVPRSGSWQEAKLIDQLLTEIKAPTSDPMVAYRGSNRWVQTYEPVQLDEAKGEAPGLREGGVYLITGGLGGIGFVLAEHLAKTVQAKLLLVGRSAFPNRDEWSQWLATHDEQDSVSCKIRQLIEFEELGAEVLVASADVTNLEQMQVVIAQAKERFGQLNGVIHAAGVPGGGVIQRKTQEEAERILAPKVKGTLVLDALLKDVQLDFFVLFSSLASAVGVVGHVDYTGANAFLDAFSHYKTSTNGTFTTCINWDVWQEVGMGAEAMLQFTQTSANEFLKTLFNEGVLSSEGINVFRRIIGNKLSHVLVSTHDFQALIEQHNANSLISSLEAAEKANLSQPTHPRPELNNAYIAPRNELEQTLANIWQTFLGIKQVGIYDNFFQLGGHSLLATQVIAQMCLAVKMDLPLSILFDEPTVADISQYIEKIRYTTQKLQALISAELDDRTEIEI